MNKKPGRYELAAKQATEEGLANTYEGTDQDLDVWFWPDEIKDFWDNEFKPLEEQ